jgi:hypothetical protein
MKLKPTIKLSEASQDLVRTSNLLKSEMLYLTQPLRKSDDLVKDALPVMFSIRSLIRAQVSHIEAVCYLIRRMLLSLPKDILISEFSHADRLKLDDKRINKSDNAEVTNRMGTKDNIDFSFKSFAKIFTKDFQLIKGTAWENFLVVLDARDRLTHPKSFDSQIISPSEWESLEKTDEWFTSETNRMLNQAKKENQFMAQP